MTGSRKTHNEIKKARMSGWRPTDPLRVQAQTTGRGQRNNDTEKMMKESKGAEIVWEIIVKEQ